MTLFQRAVCAGALLAAAGAAHAQNFIGVGTGIVPKYPGANDYRVAPVPLINYSNGMFFASSVDGFPGIGLRANLGNDLSAGVRLGVNLGRPEDRAPILRGLGDIDAHANYGAFIAWTPGRFRATLSYTQATKGYGGTANLGASYAVWQQGPHRVTAGGGLEWGNSDYMQTWFGVTPSQAARSEAGLRPYQPSSGLSGGSVFASWSYRINERWGAVTTLGVRSLVGDAKDSPIAERATRAFGMVGVTYAF